MFWKDGLSRKFASEHDLFCNNWKDGIYFSQKIWYFPPPLAKKQTCPCPEKIHLRVTSPASLKKIIFILENIAFLLKHHFDWHPRKGPRSSHQRCSTRNSVLRNFAKITGKNMCQILFFNKATGLRPATLLKKRLWRRCFPVNFAKFPRISGRLILEVIHFRRILTYYKFNVSYNLNLASFFCNNYFYPFNAGK